MLLFYYVQLFFIWYFIEYITTIKNRKKRKYNLTKFYSLTVDRTFIARTTQCTCKAPIHYPISFSPKDTVSQFFFLLSFYMTEQAFGFSSLKI